MILLALSVAPGFAIIMYILAKDKYNREPFKNLFISFLLGAVCTIPAILLESVFSFVPALFRWSGNIVYNLILAFGVVAASEEGCKLAVLKRYSIRQPAFDEPLDGIIYGVMISMGFATVENIMYVFQYGVGTGIARMFLAVPAHAAFGVMMGYFVGLAKFDQERRHSLTNQGLIMAIFFHGCYDFFLFMEASSGGSLLPSGLLTFGAIASLYFAIRYSRKAIKLHQELSKIEYEKNRDLRDEGTI